MDKNPDWTPALLKSRRRKALFLAVVLAALVVMFYLVTLVRIGGNIAERGL